MIGQLRVTCPNTVPSLVRNWTKYLAKRVKEEEEKKGKEI
jgi:hypothetical protein